MNILFVILFLMNFLRTLGIIVISYYVLKFVARLLFPVVVKKAMHNMQERQSPTRENKNEGEVTIETKSDSQNAPATAKVNMLTSRKSNNKKSIRRWCLSAGESAGSENLGSDVRGCQAQLCTECCMIIND